MGEKEADRNQEQAQKEKVKEDKKKEGAEAETQTIPPEVLEKLPPGARKQIESFFSATAFYGQFPNPIVQKVTSEHVGQIIQAQNRDTELGYTDRKESRRIFAVLFGLSAVLFVLLVIFLASYNHTDALNDLMKSLALVGGGFGGGYGFAKWRGRD